MNQGLHEKLALVTGAAQGIGKAIVTAFIQQGANVIATDINEQKLATFGGMPRVTVRKLDVTNSIDIARASADVGAIDILVNCAGWVSSGTVLDAPDSDLEKAFEINYFSTYRMCRAFLPAMIARQSGSIINIASVVSHTKAAPNRCLYASTKSAVIALTKSIAIDFVADGIRCNSISPGTVHSPSLEDRIAANKDPDAARKAFIARQPMGRLGQPEEIAAVAVLLASNEAAFMTGADLVVDGGFSL